MDKAMLKVTSKPKGLAQDIETKEAFNVGIEGLNKLVVRRYLSLHQLFSRSKKLQQIQGRYRSALISERGDVPGWVLVVLMTTGLVTAIWTIAAPRLSSILKNSLDAMNGIR
jgi:hypothetical protein